MTASVRCFSNRRTRDLNLRISSSGACWEDCTSADRFFIFFSTSSRSSRNRRICSSVSDSSTESFFSSIFRASVEKRVRDLNAPDLFETSPLMAL